MIGKRQQQLLLLESSGNRRGGGDKATGGRERAASVLMARMRQAAAAVGRGGRQRWDDQREEEEDSLRHQDSIKRREVTYDEDAWARQTSADFAAIKLRHMQESEGTTQVSGDDYGELPVIESEEDDTAAAAGGDEGVVVEEEEEEEEVGDKEEEEEEEEGGLYTYAYSELERRLRGDKEEEEGVAYQAPGREKWYYPSSRQRLATTTQITPVEEEEEEAQEEEEEEAVEEPAEEEEEYKRQEEEEEEPAVAAAYTEEEGVTAEGTADTSVLRHVGSEEGEEVAADDDAWHVEQQEDGDAEVELAGEDGEGGDETGGEGVAEDEEEGGFAGEEEENAEEEEGYYVEEAEPTAEEAYEEGEAAEEEEAEEEAEEEKGVDSEEKEEDLNPYDLPHIESLVEVREAPGKGRCLYTRNALEPGAVIFVESPVFVATPSADAELWQVLEQLNEEEAFELPPVWHMGAICSLTLLDEEKRRICLDKWVPEPNKAPGYDVLRVIERTGLAVHAQLYERMLMVWRYNSFGHHSEQPGLVLYNRISMMAHSCSATACWHYGEEDAFILRARVKLNAGDELTISYIGDEDLFKSADVRREKVNGWLFTCHCPRCSLPVDNARGFRCSACATGTMFFKTDEDGMTSSSPCTVCQSVPSEELINFYLEFEQAYVERLSETDKNDLADAKLVYFQAQRVFNQHWVLYQLHTVLFEGHRDRGDYETAAFHQMERIKYVSQVMPLASYTLAWLHEELGDTLMTKEEQEKKTDSSDNKLNLMSRCFEDAFNLLYILCGKDHDYTIAADTKKTICDKRLEALSTAAQT